MKIVLMFILSCLSSISILAQQTVSTAGGNASGVATWQTASSGSPTHTIGESFGGGIVFYVNDNGQHGLIAATADQGTSITWYNGTLRYTSTQGDGLGAGSMNTAIIIAMQFNDNQNGNFAAKICADNSVTDNGITYGDWYLPSKYELNLLYLQKTVVGGFTNNWYWSSTEGNHLVAWDQNFDTGSQLNDGKVFPTYVRAIRSF